MKEEEWKTGPGGLEPPGPLRGPTDAMKVGFRPMDPVLIERVEDVFLDLAGEGYELEGTVAVAIRNVRGFVYIPECRIKKKPVVKEPFMVVDYNTVRRTFLLSGEGSTGPVTEILWFAFKAFPDDMVMAVSGAPWEGDDPQSSDRDAMLNFVMGTLSSWKEKNPFRSGEATYWRGANMQGIKVFVKKLAKE